MPTLLQISIEVNSGSVGRIAEQIGYSVISCGWKSYITYSRTCNPSKSEVIKIGNNLDLYWHVLMTRLFDDHCLWSTKATYDLIKQIEIIQPDIIQIHHIHGYYIDMVVLFDYLSSISTPVVWTFHDCWSFTGHCAYFDSVNCEKWKTICYDCVQKNAYPRTLIFDQSKRNYNLKKKLFNTVSNMTIVSVSKWLKELVDQSFFNKYPVRIIQNGVDTTIFCPKKEKSYFRNEYNINKKNVLIGVASTWDYRKGLNDFIKLSSFLDESYVIVLVGLSNKQIQGLPANIIGLKRTENVEELAELYSLADIHISFSVEETFGLTIVESMACGTPVIVYNATACPELVTPETGVVVDKGDINDALRAVREIVKNGKMYYSQNCRNRALDFFDKKDRFNDYVILYNELLNNK